MRKFADCASYYWDVLSRSPSPLVLVDVQDFGFSREYKDVIISSALVVLNIRAWLAYMHATDFIAPPSWELLAHRGIVSASRGRHSRAAPREHEINEKLHPTEFRDVDCRRMGDVI